MPSRYEYDFLSAFAHLEQNIKQKLLEYRRATGKEDILVNSIVIDFFLWDYAKAHSAELAGFPIHFTRSVFY